MPRDSIFDPEGSQTEHGGSIFTPSDAANRSKMPPDLVDGKVPEEEEAVLEDVAEAAREVEAEREDKTIP